MTHLIEHSLIFNTNIASFQTLIERLTTLRIKLRKLKDSNLVIGKVIFKTLYVFWSISKFILNPRYRSEQVSRIKYSNEIIQVSTYTKENRYPVLFKQIALELKDIENPKILSFGCSTGEEVFSLKKIIPNADIVGVDINRWCIKKANRKNSDCNFFHANNKAWEKKNYYDCILALAIFQKSIHREPGQKVTTDLFRFSTFEKNVTELSQLLKIDGLFILDNSDYQFSDLAIFRQQFKAGPDVPIKQNRPTFNKFNNRISNISISKRIFRKIF